MTAIEQWRAKAFGAFALFCGAQLLAGCATGNNIRPSPLNPNADFAIYTANIDDMNVVGLPECPEDHICLDAVFEITLTPMEIIAGNPNVGKQTFHTIKHSAYPRDVALMIHAKREPDGKWTLLSREILDISSCLKPSARDEAEALRGTSSDWYVWREEEGNVCLRRSYRPSTDIRR